MTLAEGVGFVTMHTRKHLTTSMCHSYEGRTDPVYKADEKAKEGRITTCLLSIKRYNTSQKLRNRDVNAAVNLACWFKRSSRYMCNRCLENGRHERGNKTCPRQALNGLHWRPR
jgi:hypothetical protein